jgi:large subunit ribosomal protein L22
MQTAKALLWNLRMAPLKVRLVAGLVRGCSVDQALRQLAVSSKAAARPVRKLIESAVANATNNHGMEREGLRIQSITVDGGEIVKRSTPKAHGRATPIRHRASHVTVVLSGVLAPVKAVASEEAPAPSATTKKPARRSSSKKQ